MILPLYNHCLHEKNELVRRPCPGNTGLWYNKFFYNWNESDWSIEKGGKSKWIDKAVWNEEQNRRRKVGNPKLLYEHTDRVQQLVKCLGGQVRVYVTKWRLAVGLGLSHPIENGFGWHHTLGVPYLPGSTVKGIVKSWAEEWAENHSSENIVRIFGSKSETDENNKNSADENKIGSVIFFDALPLQPVQLAADVMTPHYQPYYAGTDKLPGDWYNPNPIPFLTVGEEQSFMFAVAPRRKEDASDVDLVLDWLASALTVIGVGAKTAVGYGRFIQQHDHKLGEML
mgnify:CR=1 FL=1